VPKERSRAAGELVHCVRLRERYVYRRAVRERDDEKLQRFQRAVRAAPFAVVPPPDAARTPAGAFTRSVLPLSLSSLCSLLFLSLSWSSVVPLSLFSTLEDPILRPGTMLTRHHFIIIIIIIIMLSTTSSFHHHHSNITIIPSFINNIIPSLHHSITPPLRHSVDPPFIVAPSPSYLWTLQDHHHLWRRRSASAWTAAAASPS
jgi:hypothetical protein